MATPNPFRPGEARHFGIIEIGGVTVPGKIQSIGGIDVEQDWNFQKASGGGPAANSANPDTQNNSGAGTINNVEPTRNTGANFEFQKGGKSTTTATGANVNTAGSFAVSVWRGAKLAEEIPIESVLTGEAEYDAAIDFISVLMPKRGRKPPSLTLVNPSANAVGITRCSVRKVGAPMEDKAGSGKWVFKFTICEYNPQKTAPAGQADPAKPPAEPTPADAQEQELKDLLDKARN